MAVSKGNKGEADTLKDLMKSMEKNYGKGILFRMGDHEREKIESISTGSIGLNNALGIGGIPVGRVIEIFGKESSGKTTLTLHVVAECQKSGKIAAFIDAEHALDPVYAEAIGVDIDNLLLSQPDYGEQALDVLEKLVSSDAVGVIVVDSVAALTPKVEIDSEMTDQQVGLQARLMSKALRKITSLLSKTNTTVIFINQIRDQIGVMGYGPKTTTTGGHALKFYSSVRLDIKRVGSIKQGERNIGNQVKVKVAKNKVAAPFKEAKFEIMFGTGISKVGELVDYGVEYDLIEKAGAWFSYGGERVAQGKERMKKYLTKNPEIADKLEAAIIEKLKPKEEVKK